MTNESAPIIHKSVLVNEVLENLALKPHGLYVDVTFGSGGHTRAILQADPTVSVIALDWDATSLDTYGPVMQEEFGSRLTLIWGNFSHLYKLLKKKGIERVDGVLADFGTSQMQIFDRAGFSVYRDTALDMRMSSAHHQLTAQEVVNKFSQSTLEKIFWDLGEERYARQIAAAILEARKKKRITTTGELAALVERCVPRDRKSKIHPATRIFQALRIYVNHELENINAFLAASLYVLKNEGRLVCISFHSLEDRLVKQFYKNHERTGELTVVTSRVVVATEEEMKQNPSSRSAKLRAAQAVKGS